MAINGHNDDFLINDILLSISPTEIHVTKDSLNSQWQTLRTNNSQKTKSGHSTINIEFTVPFIGNDIQKKLQPLIAELRYFPFAFVENQFVRENLFPEELENSVADVDSTTIVLAIRNINIRIDNEEQDIVWATFQFVYFNYFPYTPYWQYKKDLTGDDANKTVSFPHLSDAWKKFVAAAIADGKGFSEVPDGTAVIKFLELKTGPVSTVEELDKTKQILSDISANQKTFFTNLRSSTSSTLDKSLLDTLGSTFPQYKDATSVSSIDLIEKLLLNASPKSNPLSSLYRSDDQLIDQNDLKQVFSQLDQRILAKQKFMEETNNGNYELIKELVSSDNRGHGFGIFKRVRELKLSSDNGYVLTGINISIQNILATLPIIGHRYATFQHIGSIDSQVTIEMKALHDEAMRNASWFYDTVNENMIANRHIPQGLQTIRIENPFLSLFNLKEFITQDLQVDTIPGQPGTFNIKMSLVESGLKQTDKIDDSLDDKFSLEFAGNDSAVIKEIIKAIDSSIELKNKGNFFYFEPSSVNGKSKRFQELVRKYVGGFLFDGNKIVQNPGMQGFSFKDFFTFESKVSKSDLNAWFLNRTDSTAEAQFTNPDFIDNTGLNNVANKIYDIATDGNNKLFETLFAITEDDIPGIDKIKELVFDKYKAKNTDIPGVTFSGDRDTILNQLKDNAAQKIVNTKNITDVQQARALNKQLNFGNGTVREFAANSKPTPAELKLGILLGNKGAAPQSSIDKQLETSTNVILKNAVVLKWADFLSSFTRSIIDTDDIELPEFASARSMMHQIGLGRGLPAYNDFHLEKVAEQTEYAGNIDYILNLDPDCFLSTPMDVDINDIIDPSLIANAKRIAQTSYDSAINQISKFYQWSWLPNFLTDYLRDAITKNINLTVNEHGSDNSKVAEHSADPFTLYYANNIALGKFQNAAKQNEIDNTSIKIGGLSLFNGSIPQSTNSEISVLRSYKSITHSMNPADLFSHSDPGPNSLSTQNKKVKKLPDSISKKAQGDTVTHASCPEGGYVSIDPLKLAAQAGVDLEVYSLARMISSEEGLNPKPYLIGVGWACVNKAKNTGIKVSTLLLTAPKKGNGYYGSQSQSGRYAATRQDPYQVHIDIASGILDGSIPDNTGGATNFFSPKTQDDAKVRERVKDQKKTAQEVITSWTTGSKGNLEIVSVQGVDPYRLTFFKPKHRGTSRSIPAMERTSTSPAAIIKTSPAISPVEWKNDNSTTGHTVNTYARSADTGLAAGLNVLDMSIDGFKKSLQNGQANRLVRAFPAYKLYFIQDDSGNRRRYGADDFFSYNSVVEIKCIRSRKIPADLLEITLTNVSGVLTNRKFQGPRQTVGSSSFDRTNEALDKNGNVVQSNPKGFLNKDTAKENPIASMMLKVGIDVECRLGFSNDPDKLTTVFDGKIMEIEFSDSDDLVKIICQSHVIELVQHMKGLAEPIVKDGLFVNDARTDYLLESMLAEPEVVHFGRYIRSKSLNGDTNNNRSLLTNKFTLSPTPQDDNIFVPSLPKLKELDPGWFLNDLKYNIYHTTIWDIFDEMTLRHPGWIKSAVPYKGKYGPRMTMFFGLPSQLYFASDPTEEEKTAGAKLKENVDNFNNEKDKLLNSSLYKVVQDNIGIKGLKSWDEILNRKPVDFAEKRLELARDFESIKPFRSYHMITSRNHIISNNIRASAKNTYNTISIQYGKSSWNKTTKELVQEGTDILSLSLDAALPDDEVRELFVSYKNCQTSLMARHYATSCLLRELKDVYKGEVVIIGNAEIKPFDIVYCVDDYTGLTGPIEVEQVIHRFSQDTGFITEITPDLFVTANEWVNMTAVDMMSIIVQGTASSLDHGTVTTTESEISKLRGTPFLASKMVDFTSHGSPVVIHPLIYRGKPFIAGLPVAKLDNLWSVDKGEWIKQAVDGLDLLVDDFNDKLTLAPSQGSLSNLFSGNSIPPKF